MKKKNGKRHTYYDPKKTKVALHPQEPKEIMAESSDTDIATILTLAFGPDWRYSKAWDNPRQALRPSEAILRDAAIAEFLMLREFVSSSSTARTLLLQFVLGHRRRSFAEGVEEEVTSDGFDASAQPAWLQALKRARARGHLKPEHFEKRKPALPDDFRERIKAGLRAGKHKVT